MELTQLIDVVTQTFDDLGIPYLITGSVASITYGEPRFTNDIDIVADLRAQHIPQLLLRFPIGEYYISEEAMREAIRDGRQFNIIHPTSGLKVDVIIRSQNAFDESRFQRRKIIALSATSKVSFAAPEDVIIKKMEYYREGGSEKHLRDITGILKISGDVVDKGYIETWAMRLGLHDIWQAILKRIKNT